MFEDESQPPQALPQPPYGQPDKQPSSDEIPDIFDGSGSTGAHMPDSSPETTMHGPSALEAGKLQQLQEPVQPLGMDMPTESADLHEPTAIKRIMLAAVILVVLALIGAGVWYFVIREVKQAPVTPVVTTPEQQVPTPAATEPEPGTGTVDVDVTQPIQPVPATTTPTTIPEPQPIVDVQTDSDKDGLTDAKESQLGTSSVSPDSDSDGLTDGAEVSIWGTDPLNKDSDGDTYPDGQEVLNGFNPKGDGKLR